MSIWLTVETARERVETIRTVGPGDDEAGHAMEDELRRDLLETIAELVEIVRETEGIDFSRWCA